MTKASPDGEAFVIGAHSVTGYAVSSRWTWV